EQPIH
ncbi:HAD hydrolase, IIB family protein, partial [Vibrio parahaemolyticus V-223/04]